MMVHSARSRDSISSCSVIDGEPARPAMRRSPNDVRLANAPVYRSNQLTSCKVCFGSKREELGTSICFSALLLTPDVARCSRHFALGSLTEVAALLRRRDDSMDKTGPAFQHMRALSPTSQVPPSEGAGSNVRTCGA